MGFDFSPFGGGLDEQYVDWLIAEQSPDMALHFEKLWSYYHNEMRESIAPVDAGGLNPSNRPYRQAQEYGLPSRITGMHYGYFGGLSSGRPAEGIQRKEVVIENDIAWRVDTMVDFLFGKDITIVSRAPEAQRATEIGQILRTMLDANGGSAFLQQLALLGGIFGFVDVILRWGGAGKASSQQGPIDSAGTRGGREGGLAAVRPKTILEVLRIVRDRVVWEAVEAPRSLPILAENEYRHIEFYIQHYWQRHNCLAEADESVVTVNRNEQRGRRQKVTHNVEIIGPRIWQRYENRELVGQGPNPLGVVPVVHMQNLPVPLRYEGISDVEPLIPLQDELNTRLSDRANRITFQSFKMYLGKGIEGFEDRSVGPGRMWSTENPEAQIEEFGGDAGSPSEEAHINHIREALDKASGVASVAAGILKGRIGNLTSAVALKMTLMGVLAKTERKRKCYGQGIKHMCRLALGALDSLGLYPNRPEERDVEIHWSSPLPENLMEKLQEAKLKKELGVRQEQILQELGYSEVDQEK
ncbi:MAG: phage portal protein [Sedimentisphaerales bacterium]|nr:phage portal protein [Sedimentisphaerales bacterium]